MPVFPDDLAAGESLRLGVLGTGRVLACGLLAPARRVPGIEVAAVASRSMERAQACATQFSIARPFSSYAALLDEPAIEAVYVALPPSLHEEWVLRALDAKKHVLCEKPLSTSAASARRMAESARVNDRCLQEAMHIVFSTGLTALRERVERGELGPLSRIESCFRIPFIPMEQNDFRQSPELGGGALLDLGCYAVSSLCLLVEGTPEITAAESRWLDAGVDCWTRAELRFPSGVTGAIECGFHGSYTPRLEVTVTGEGGSEIWRLDESPTYQRQLEAFVAWIRGEARRGVSLEHSIAVLSVLDAILAKTKT